MKRTNRRERPAQTGRLWLRCQSLRDRRFHRHASSINLIVRFVGRGGTSCRCAKSVFSQCRNSTPVLAVCSNRPMEGGDALQGVHLI